MSRVLYGPTGNQSRLIPAPLVTINKTYQRANDGEIIGKLYTISVTGTIVAHMGSPMSDGTFHKTSGYPANESISADARLTTILTKQNAIRNLFSTDGQIFEIQGADGGQSLRCNPRVMSIEFPEDIWYERSNYSITLECDEFFGFDEDDDFPEYLSSATEEWTIDTNEEPQAIGASTTYTLTHSIAAVGKTSYNSEGNQPFYPWQYAERYVLSRLGFDNTMALSSGVNNLPSYYNEWNHRRSNQIDKKGGGYSVTESWLLASGEAVEDFTITTSADLETPHNRVSIQGNVKGFEERSSNMGLVTTKWDNAQTKFAWASGIAYLRAQQYSGLNNLNIEPLTITVGRNPLQGTIDYTMEFNTRPAKLIEGAKSESISIGDNIGGQVFASVFVLGRTRGPVLQDLGTKPSNMRTLNIEIVVDPPTFSDRTVATMRSLMINQKPINNPAFSGNLNNLLVAANPAGQGFTTVFQDQPQENWDFLAGRYTYSTMWTYE